MELPVADPRLAACITASLECPECMSYTARNVMAVCGSRDPRGIERIFNVLYPAPECQVMKEAFHAGCDDEFASMTMEFGAPGFQAAMA